MRRLTPHQQRRKIDLGVPVKKEKTPMEKKEFVMKKFGGLIMGYKVRRILRNHKLVRNLRKEVKDLVTFAAELKKDVKE